MAYRRRGLFPDGNQGTIREGKGTSETSTTPSAFPPPSSVYVGLATVTAATWWFLYDAEGPRVTFYQLVSRGGLRVDLRWNSQLRFWGVVGKKGPDFMIGQHPPNIPPHKEPSLEDTGEPIRVRDQGA